ncbi:MAG: beta galactosidase jelly roll domain-containing protein [Lentisphaerae bacterium]|nr:beta galactosidase jelly roll domain-containing protein [Lentisphaerota bacterium]
MSRISVISMKKGTLVAGTLLLGLTLSSSVHGADNDASVLERHNGLVDAVGREGTAAVPALIKALDDDHEMVHLTAAYLLVRLGEAARPGFAAALDSPHVEVRRIVMRGLANLDLVEEYWATILLDNNPVIRRYVQLVLMPKHPLPEGEKLDRIISELRDVYLEADVAQRRHVVETFAAFDVVTPASRRVLVLATDDEEADIRQTAYAAILDHIDRDWDEAADLLDAAQADSSETIRDIGLELRWKLLQVAQVRLSREGWRFLIDPDDIGRAAGWYAPDWDDAGWRDDVPIEDSWKNHMEDGYNGIAWYRRSIDVPEAPDGDRVYLHFEGVDEEAWVWLNGKFVGEHALGKEGWNVPFVLDATDAVKLGAENQVTIRAKNTSGGAGIWRPVTLRVLNTDKLKKP